MADISHLAADWPTLSRRLDEALTMAPPAREDWLAALPEPDSIKRQLRQLLGEPAAVETGAFAGTLPKLTLASDPNDATTGARIGPYRLIRELGSGGMGQVWLAERVDGALRRQVALKLPRMSWSGGLDERLRRERDILASLDHPHIARLYDAGVDTLGRPYLALEYVEGEPIDVHARRQGLGITQRLRLILQVAHAVAHAHSRLVVHRDLKPANILVDVRGQVRLLDFGIAKLMEGELTRETQLTQHAGRALTLDYASPEQIRGEPIGTASDVYSLGVVAYELLAQAKPYQIKRHSAAALEEAIASVDVRPASVAAGSTAGALDARALQGDLDAILNKALKKSVADRYPTVEALALDIERHLANLPVAARPDGAVYRLRKFVARNRLAIGAGAAVVASVLVGAGVATWKAVEARDERVRAERVKDMIGSIFATANPFGAGKVDVGVRDLLKAGVDRVQHDLPGEPAVAAELLSLISSSYRDLGETELALSTARDAQRLASSAYPEGHAMPARVQRVLAQALSDKGQGEQAHRLLDQAIATQRRLGDAGAVELARSMGFLSSVLVDEGRVEQSIAMGRDVVALLLRVRGERDVLTIDAIGDLSDKLMVGGHGEMALHEAQRGHRLARAAFADPAHPTTTQHAAHVAYAMAAVGQYRAAAEQFRLVIDAARKTFNPRGPQVAMALQGLAVAQEYQGELKAALANYEESLGMMQGYGAGVNGEVAIRHYSIGRVALLVRQSDKALAALDQAIAYGKAMYGERGGRVRDAENFRAAALVYAGRFSEAQALLDAQLALDRQSRSPALRASLHNSALLDTARGQHAAALVKIAQAQRMEAGLKGLPAKAIAQTWAELGRAQLEGQLADQAMASLKQAVTAFAGLQSEDTPQQADAWLALGRAHLALLQTDDALSWTGKSQAFWMTFDPKSPFAGEAAYWHGAALRENGQGARARAQWARAAPLLDASTWPAHRRLALLARAALRGG